MAGYKALRPPIIRVIWNCLQSLSTYSWDQRSKYCSELYFKGYLDAMRFKWCLVRLINVPKHLKSISLLLFICKPVHFCKFTLYSYLP